MFELLSKTIYNESNKGFWGGFYEILLESFFISGVFCAGLR